MHLDVSSLVKQSRQLFGISITRALILLIGFCPQVSVLDNVVTHSIVLVIIVQSTKVGGAHLCKSVAALTCVTSSGTHCVA